MNQAHCVLIQSLIIFTRRSSWRIRFTLEPWKTWRCKRRSSLRRRTSTTKQASWGASQFWTSSCNRHKRACMMPWELTPGMQERVQQWGPRNRGVLRELNQHWIAITKERSSRRLMLLQTTFFLHLAANKVETRQQCLITRLIDRWCLLIMTTLYLKSKRCRCTSNNPSN